jgi:hypothetical protein
MVGFVTLGHVPQEASMITQWIVIAFVVVGLALVHWADRAR